MSPSLKASFKSSTARAGLVIAVRLFLASTCIYHRSMNEPVQRRTAINLKGDVKRAHSEAWVRQAHSLLPEQNRKPRGPYAFTLLAAFEQGRLVCVRCGNCNIRRVYDPGDLKQPVGDVGT